MPRPAAGLAAAAVILAALDAPPAEIRRKVGAEGEIVAVNVRPPAAPRRVPAPRGRGSAEGEAPRPSTRLASLLEETSGRYAFDPALIRAVVQAESAFDPMAVSRKGARGLMQLMPSTARRFGVRDVHDPEANLDAGVAYLRELSLRHPGRMDLALAAYNAGPEAVSRHGGIPPYGETRRYISRIRAAYGKDLNEGDWIRRRGAIRIKKVDSEGVPHFTNMKRRRIIGPPGAGRPARQAPGPGGDQ